MSDNRDAILQQLNKLNLDQEEAKVYLELLHGSSTHLRLSVITGINRTKVYRLIENLEKRSLVARRTDDRGTFLVAADPATLEVALVTQEEIIKQQRAVFKQLLPTLESFKSSSGHAFVLRTYEGIEGLKQMCWHELKTRGELLGFGGQTIEDLIINHRWAEKHRALAAEAGYLVREILNYDIDKPAFTQRNFTENRKYMNHFHWRQLPSSVVYFNEQTVIYNDTVAIYHWREDQKVGVEIISPSYATMMRNVFENYWKVAKEGGKSI